MKTLAGQMLTKRGAAAFWLLWSMAFVLMLWAVSPGRTLQDALAAELLQGHLAGGYQLRNPPLYEWLLWGVQQAVGPGPLSYLILRYALIATTGILFYVALLRTVASRRLFPLARAVLLVRLGDPSKRLPHARAARRGARAFHRRARLCRAADGGPCIPPRTDHWPRAHGQMELPARAAEPCGGACNHAGDAADVPRAAHAARARRRRIADPAVRSVVRHDRFGPCRPPHDAPWARAVARPGASGPRRLPHRHPARISPVDRLHAVLRLAVPKDAVTAGHAVSGGGDQARKPHRDRDAGADGCAPAVRVCDWRRTVRHQPLRHPLSLPVLSVRGARACRPRRATRGGAAFRPEARDRFARRGSRHLFRKARELLCSARGFGGDQPPPLRAVGRRAHKARARLSAIRDAVATRRRQPRHLFA